MALSSILRTPAHLSQFLPFRAAELIDERRAIVPGGGLGHVERHDDSVIRVGVEYVLDDGVRSLGLVAEARRHVGENISHIITAHPVLVIAELTPDENGPDPVLERES